MDLKSRAQHKAGAVQQQIHMQIARRTVIGQLCGASLSFSEGCTQLVPNMCGQDTHTIYNVQTDIM